ncbi:hypothetical protein LSAT2_006499 [Lamellibrachia satsuma]|nr:hypothetical protein LSAT2_006499 [Lamellibrachia satsuma]
MIKRCGWTVLCLTIRPRSARYGWTCQELPPTGIAQRVIEVHKSPYHDKLCRQFYPFCRGFLTYAMHHGMNTSPNNYAASADGHITTVPFLLRVCLVHEMPEWIDFKWCDRMQCLVTKRMMLGDALNWLSTLGGAYSALGDYYQHHAVHAGEISMSQLRLAMEVGDEPTVIRCHLYFALSLMQRGQLRLSRSIIRYQYKQATALPVTDRQLLDVCKGLWTKLRYLYERRKVQTIPQCLQKQGRES